jgi:hypothetical protein
VPWARRRPRRAALTVLIIVIVGAAIGSAGHKGGSGPTTANHSTKWPSGATRNAILSPVTAAIRSCAKAATASPANCPQQGTGTQTIVWTLYGDPTAGAQISYDGGVFTVLGHAAMSEMDESTYSAPSLHVDQVGYDATVNWNAGHPALATMGHLEKEPTPGIVVPQPTVSDSAVQQAVGAAFTQCFAATKLSLPPQCLGLDFSGGTNSQTGVIWHPQEDPLLNSRVTYDSGYGIFHVVGSYSVRVSWQLEGSPESQASSGNYDAQVLETSGQLQVVDITQG